MFRRIGIIGPNVIDMAAPRAPSKFDFAIAVDQQTKEYDQWRNVRRCLRVNCHKMKTARSTTVLCIL